MKKKSVTLAPKTKRTKAYTAKPLNGVGPDIAQTAKLSPPATAVKAVKSAAKSAGVKAIEQKYEQLGGEHGLLGRAHHEVSKCPDGVGHYCGYQHGSIHWHPETGACETHGSIRSYWAANGWETGFLGYPISDELNWTGEELWEMLPPDEFAAGSSVTGTPFALLGYLVFQNLAPDKHVHLGRISRFQNGCVTCWETVKPPFSGDVWGWTQGAGGKLYVPKLL